MSTFLTTPTDNLLEIGKNHYQKREPDQAIEVLKQYAVSCQDKMTSDFLEAHLFIGKSYIHKKSFAKSTKYLLIAREGSRKTGDKVLLAKSILQIGILYNLVFYYPKAIQHFEEVKEHYFDLLTKEDTIQYWKYLGKSYFLSFEIEKAENCFEEVIKLTEKQPEYQESLALTFAYLGRIYTFKKNFDKALRFTKRAGDLMDNNEDVDGLQLNLINLGDIHCQLEKYNEAIRLTSRGIAAAKRMKDTLNEIRGYQIMAEIFRKQKDYKSAVMYQMVYTKFYEDFYQRNDRLMVSDIEYQFMIEMLQER